MEEVFKRHVASDLSLTGAYKSEFGEDSEITQVIDRVEVCVQINFFLRLLSYIFSCLFNVYSFNTLILRTEAFSLTIHKNKIHK